MFLNSKPLEPLDRHTRPADAERLQAEQHSKMQRTQSFELGGPEKLRGAIRDTLHEKTEVWKTTGIWMMATSSVTQCWYCPTHKRSTRPTLAQGQSKTNRKQKSTTTLQTLTQLLLSGKSTTFAHWLLLPQKFTEMSQSELQWDLAGVSQTISCFCQR